MQLGEDPPLTRPQEVDQSLQVLLTLRPHQCLCPIKAESLLSPCAMGLSFTWATLTLGLTVWVTEGVTHFTLGLQIHRPGHHQERQCGQEAHQDWDQENRVKI
jgi:hypothetical protein